MIVEISYTNDEDDLPEHYAYCGSVDEAYGILQQLEEELKNAETEGE